jgi:uncharacterized protein YggE|uniref:DUF541 domain-containing protein n=1 Tax=Desulfobacca acetoxidans TaxID=60893 RepID=A0A7C5ALD8_9BACT
MAQHAEKTGRLEGSAQGKEELRQGPSLIPVLALLISVLLSSRLVGAAERSMPSCVEVEAEGQVVAKPDKAIFNFGVLTEGADPQEASQANAKEAERFLAALKGTLGPEDKVQTQEYRVFPIFRTKEQVKGKDKTRTDEVAGYRAYHRFRVELRDLGRLGQVADTAMRSGATQVQGPFFSHTQEEDLQRQAAVKALERARKLSEALAQTSGLKLARVLKISTSHSLPSANFTLAKAAPTGRGEVETPMEVGELTFRARLTVTYELTP